VGGSPRTQALRKRSDPGTTVHEHGYRQSPLNRQSPLSQAKRAQKKSSALAVVLRHALAVGAELGVGALRVLFALVGGEVEIASGHAEVLIITYSARSTTHVTRWFITTSLFPSESAVPASSSTDNNHIVDIVVVVADPCIIVLICELLLCVTLCRQQIRITLCKTTHFDHTWAPLVPTLVTHCAP
jgi:hypothetical protein